MLPHANDSRRTRKYEHYTFGQLYKRPNSFDGKISNCSFCFIVHQPLPGRKLTVIYHSRKSMRRILNCISKLENYSQLYQLIPKRVVLRNSMFTYKTLINFGKTFEGQRSLSRYISTSNWLRPDVEV